MTTDTAVRVTRIVIQEQSESMEVVVSCGFATSIANSLPVPLKDVPYVDHPDLKINDHESTQMPFRYVKGEDGEPIMPKVGNLWSTWRILLIFISRACGT